MATKRTGARAAALRDRMEQLKVRVQLEDAREKVDELRAKVRSNVKRRR